MKPRAFRLDPILERVRRAGTLPLEGCGLRAYECGMSSRWRWCAVGLLFSCACADDDVQRFRSEPLRDAQPSAADAASDRGVTEEPRDAAVAKPVRAAAAAAGGKSTRSPDAGQPAAAPEQRPSPDVKPESTPVTPVAPHMDP